MSSLPDYSCLKHFRSVPFAQALAQQGIEHRLEIIPGAGHTFHLQPPQKDLRPLVVEFLDKHLKGP